MQAKRLRRSLSLMRRDGRVSGGVVDDDAAVPDFCCCGLVLLLPAFFFGGFSLLGELVTVVGRVEGRMGELIKSGGLWHCVVVRGVMWGCMCGCGDLKGDGGERGKRERTRGG